MQGLYLYCIRKKCDNKIKVEGIDNAKVFTMLYQDVEAVISNIGANKFGSKEIAEKAKDDLKWIAAHAASHENVIEEAMRNGREIMPVIPMKFGVIFKTEKNLKKILTENYQNFKKTLEKLKGKQERGLKIYLDRKLLEKEVKKVSPKIMEKEKEIAGFPEGIAYLMQKEADEVILQEADNILKKYIADIFENLKKLADDFSEGKILAKEFTPHFLEQAISGKPIRSRKGAGFTGKTMPMVLNASFLVSENKLKNFQEKVGELSKKYKTKGFYFEHSGPWPPYNFI